MILCTSDRPVDTITVYKLPTLSCFVVCCNNSLIWVIFWHVFPLNKLALLWLVGNWSSTSAWLIMVILPFPCPFELNWPSMRSLCCRVWKVLAVLSAQGKSNTYIWHMFSLCWTRIHVRIWRESETRKGHSHEIEYIDWFSADGRNKVAWRSIQHSA